MFRLFSFDFFNKKSSSRDDYFGFEGFAFGLFLVLPWRMESYGKSCYSDHSLKDLNWFQKLIHRKNLKNYIAFCKGEYDDPDSDKGEWGGIPAIRLNSFIQVRVNVMRSIFIHTEKETEEHITRYKCSDHSININTIITKFTSTKIVTRD